MKRKILFLIALSVGLYSCNSEFEPDQVDEPEITAELVTDSLRVSMETNLSPTVHYIGNMTDLCTLYKEVAISRAEELAYKKWKKTDIVINDVPTRANSVTEYTKYDGTSYPIANSQFKARFSQSFVNQVNATVSSGYQISASKTYICGWRYIEKYHNLLVNQSGGYKESPNCGFIPSYRDSYENIGYEMYVNNYRQFLMTTNILNISYEDVSSPTTLLNIQRPPMPRTGYEFNYAILTIE